MHFNHRSKFRKIIIAFLFGVLIILLNCLFIGKNYLSIMNRSSKQIVDKNVDAIDKNDTVLLSSNDLPNREAILEKTRSKIRTELQHYNFSYSDAHELKDLVMEVGGNPQRSVLVSTWRSGSTFLGELMSAAPGTFYNYEPFVHHRAKQIRGPPYAEKDLRMLRSLLKCNYKHDNVKVFFEHKKIDAYHFRHQSQMKKYCKHRRDRCHDAEFTEDFCRLFPFLTVKLVRLRLRVLQNIMQEDELNVKLVLLVRDPRAVMQSRSSMPGCLHHPDCGDPGILCSDMVSDYDLAAELLRQYPTRFTVVRYEHLALNPKHTAHKLYEFLELDALPALDEFIDTHTNSTKDCGIYCTYRWSSDHAFHWKYVMDFEYVNKIQTVCEEAMMLWGYRIADNATHMNSTEFYPLDSDIGIKTLY